MTSNLELQISFVLADLGFNVCSYSEMSPTDPSNTFYEQFPAGGFKIDFACPQCQIAIEVDGRYWHSKTMQKMHDLFKVDELLRRGWVVLHISERDLLNDQLPNNLDNWILNQLTY